MSSVSVFTLSGGAPWGLRLQGGADYNQPLRIAKINPNSKAYNEGLQVGDYVNAVNGQKTHGIKHSDAQQIIKNARDSLQLQITRGDHSRHNGSVNSDIYSQDTRSQSSSGMEPQMNSHGYYEQPMSPRFHDGSHSPRYHDGSHSPRYPSPFEPPSPRSSSQENWNQREQHPGSSPHRITNISHRLEAPRNVGHVSPNRPPTQRTQQPINPYHPGPMSPPATRPKPAARFNAQSLPRNVGSKSKGMDLFLKQQDKLTQLGADEQENLDKDIPSSFSNFNEKPPDSLVNGSPRIESTSPRVGKGPGFKPTKFTPAPTKPSEKPRPQQPQNEPSAFRDMAPVWTPGGTGSAKKEYKPVKLDTSKPPERKVQQSSPTQSRRGNILAWREHYMDPDTDATPRGKIYQPPEKDEPLSLKDFANISEPSQSTLMNGSIDSLPDSVDDHHKLPPTQSPFITLLQKSREGKLPKGAVYIGANQTIEGNKKHTDEYYAVPVDEETTEQTVIEKKPVTYDGIGPIEHESGVPLAFRKNVDEANQHDWYKQMYKSLHKSDKKEETNTYKPTYTFPDDLSDTRSVEEEVVEPRAKEDNPYVPSYALPSHKKEDSGYRSEPEYRNRDPFKNLSKSTSTLGSSNRATDKDAAKKFHWSPPNARAKHDVYRNQPRSIMEYEPGFSSIAFRENKQSNVYNPPIDKPGQFSDVKHVNRQQPQYASDTELDSGDIRDLYKKVQGGGDIPIKGFQKPAPEKPKTLDKPKSPAVSTLSVGKLFKHPTTVEKRHQIRAEKTKQRKEDEQEYRRNRMLEIYEEQKRRQLERQEADQKSRKHSDFSPHQKSPITQDRFEDPSFKVVEKPKPANVNQGSGYGISADRRRGFNIQGKVRALYSFQAQNPKELSFRRGDTIYLQRQLDGNWFEGELNGRTGIFPNNYVEVLASIDEAKNAAAQAEGKARAKYDFRSQSNVELSLRKGENIVLLRRVDDNWFEGKSGGRQGIFPAAYVEILNEPSTPLVTPAPSVIATPMTGRGTPELMSPGAFDVPTPPPQPSPSTFTRSSASNQYSAFKQPSSSSPTHPSQALLQSALAFDSEFGQLSPTQKHQTLSPRETIKPSQPSSVHPAKQPLSVNVSSKAKQQKQAPPPQQKLQEKKIDDDFILKRQPGRFFAQYTYNPMNEDELELKEGDEVFVMEKCDDGWFVGTSARTGMFGTFPGNYVKAV